MVNLGELRTPNITNYVQFNNKTSKDLGLKILNTFKFNIPDRDVTFQSIPGVNRDMPIDNHRFKNVGFGFEADFVGNPLVPTVADLDKELAAWLFGTDLDASDEEIDYKSIYFTGDPGYYRKGIPIKGPTLERAKDTFARNMSVEFETVPGKYTKGGEVFIDITNKDKEKNQLFNVERFDSSPVIKVTGSGNIGLTINGLTYQLKGVNGWFIIDNENHEIYDENGLRNNDVTFPAKRWIKLPAKQWSVFDWSGNVTKVEVMPNWWTLG